MTALPNQHERKAPKDEPSRSSDINESKAESLQVAFCFDILLYHVSCPVISLHMKKCATDSDVICFFLEAATCNSLFSFSLCFLTLVVWLHASNDVNNTQVHNGTHLFVHVCAILGEDASV